MLDDDGYPTDEALKRITEWSWHDIQAMLDFVQSLWWCRDLLWAIDGDILSASTGGWSGNESLVAAMQKNIGFWHMCWESSRRGGHYTFDLSRIMKAAKTA
jgi:hypothetical protein